MWSKALRLGGLVRDPNALHVMTVEYVCRHAKDFDLVHFHLDYYPLSAMSRQVTPFLTTLHGRLDPPNISKLFTAGKRAARLRRSTMRLSRSMSSSSARRRR